MPVPDSDGRPPCFSTNRFMPCGDITKEMNFIASSGFFAFALTP
jgi:hypothetical protein